MIQPQRQPQREDGHGHQFKEAAPGVLGVGQAAIGDDLLAAEEVSELHQHERAEQHIDQPQDDAGFDDTQPEQRACLAFGRSFIRCFLQRHGVVVAVGKVGFRVCICFVVGFGLVRPVGRAGAVVGGYVVPGRRRGRLWSTSRAIR